MAEIVLHIGSFKSGTTFIQACLKKNRRSLARQGVLVPEWDAQAGALRALLDRGSSVNPIVRDRWDDLADEASHWGGSRVVISMEFLSLLGEKKAMTALDAFPPSSVRVLLTARDLRGALPAQWQTSLRGGGRTWTLNQYVKAATARRPYRRPAGRHFWRRHNWPAILNRWGSLNGYRDTPHGRRACVGCA